MSQYNHTSAIPSHVYGRESNSPASESSGMGDNNGYPQAACSPAPSNSSLFSEQEPIEQGNRSRQSPFHAICQASPSSSYSTHAFTRPDFLNLPTSIPDSETSSRSSADGITLSKQLFRGRRRKNSSDSSGSEGSNFTVGGESVEGDEAQSRKSSRTKVGQELPDDLPPVVKAAIGPRNRLDKIRRESSCSIETEVAHERLVRNSQQVSQGFDEFCIDTEHRKRIPSVSGVVDPISVVTNSLLPHSCSPSPTRHADAHKQCYSPSTQLIVRNNISYSPSRSPTSSPTRSRLLRSGEAPRSLSPIATRGTLKRRYTASGVGEDYDIKRSMLKACTSPLVTDRAFPYPPAAANFHIPQEFAQPLPSSSSSPNPFSMRRPSLSLVEGDLRRRNSVDSTSDDQKSFRDDISEPSSIQILDESMEVDCNSEQKSSERSELPPMIPEESDSSEKMDKNDYEVYREFIEEPQSAAKESMDQLPSLPNHVNPMQAVPTLLTMGPSDIEFAINAPLPSDDDEDL